MKNNFYSFITLIVFISLFIASAPQKEATTSTVKTYAEVSKKSSEPINFSYEYPVIKPINGTVQTQRKGGVTITCEVIPFEVSLKERVLKSVFYADPKMPGYDIFEVARTPYASVTPEKFILNIKVKNNQDRILKIRETALLMQVDGVNYNMPEADTKEWYAAMVIKNGEFNYRVNGPDVNNLMDAKLVYLMINDVPTIMDAAGNIKNRENFEWYFECKKETVQKQSQKTYTYETVPVETKRCERCVGKGVDPDDKCPRCQGAGKNKNRFDGRWYDCSTCKTTGIVKQDCLACKGKGAIAFPKSQLPPETSSTSWSGWAVNVVTNPPGAVVKVVNPTSKNYYDAGTSNSSVNWTTSNSTSYPIIVEYQGKSVKVLPYDKKGKAITKVVIDFSSGQPIVKEGSLAN